MPALQAKAGGFSAYAYELLPLMHTLMGHNKVETDLLSADVLAFLSGFTGHITPVMQDFAANAKRGAVGREAASQKNHANSLVKVCSTDSFMHPTNVSDSRCPLRFGSIPASLLPCAADTPRPCMPVKSAGIGYSQLLSPAQCTFLCGSEYQSAATEVEGRPASTAA